MDGTRTIADRYVLGPLIATGGMAEVYEARDEVLARKVAVKVLRAHLGRDQDVVARFRQEALAAARLTHPNIVAIYDTGSEESEGDEQHFIVMEYCPRGPLSSALHDRGPFEGEEVASAGETICNALSYAHAEGVIHRDIKPGNVLIVDHGSLKVADFGIAKAAFGSGDITTTGSIIGTVTYISPEQARGDEPDPRSDLYSLGVLLYELATGRPPFKGETDVATALSHVREPPPPPRSLRAGVSKPLEGIILKALQKDPDDRFTSADEMRHELGALGSSAGTQRIRVPVGSSRPDLQVDSDADTGPLRFIKTEGRRNGPVFLLVIAAIAAAVVVAALVGSQTDDPGRTGGSNGPGSQETRPVQPSSASDFDPHGGDGEHPELVANAHDEDPSTSWRTSEYHSALSLQKPGVGLLFDLGSEVDVSEVAVQLDRAGYSFELRAANSTGPNEEAFELISEIDNSDAEQVVEVGDAFRYWLVWLTAFPDGGGRGVVREVSFVGR